MWRKAGGWEGGIGNWSGISYRTPSLQPGRHRAGATEGELQRGYQGTLLEVPTRRDANGICSERDLPSFLDSVFAVLFVGQQSQVAEVVI